MPRVPRPTEKLLKVAKGTNKGSSQRGRGRRAAFSAATRGRLLQVAAEQFATEGYAGTSLESIVTGADVTKGALYHHFSGKQALFEAVCQGLEEGAAEQIAEAMSSGADPWARAMDGLRACLVAVREPAYHRIVIQDGPAVLGYERFREQEERTTFALVEDMVRQVLSSTGLDLDEAMIRTFARIFAGAVSAVGEGLGAASDPDAETQRIETAIGFVLAGMRTLVDAGQAPALLEDQ